MKIIQTLGISLLVLAVTLFTVSAFVGNFQVSSDTIDKVAKDEGFSNQTELVDAFQQPFAESALVGTAVGSVLAIDEAEVGLTVVVGVGEGELEPILTNVSDRVQGRLLPQFLLQ